MSEQFKSYFNFNNALNKKNDLLGVTHGIHKELINLIFNLCKRYVYKIKRYVFGFYFYFCFLLLYDLFHIKQ